MFAIFPGSLLGKAFEKQTKTIEDHEKELCKSNNELVEKDFNTNRGGVTFEKKKNLMNLLKKNPLNLRVYKIKLIQII